MHKLTAALLSSYDVVFDVLAKLESKLAAKFEDWHAAALTRVATAATTARIAAADALEELEARAKQLLNAAEYVLEAAEEKEKAMLEWVRAELAKIGR